MSIVQDYIDLFSFNKQGHMAKYVHLHDPDIYNHILSQEDYYLFKCEIDLLAQKSDLICNHFQPISKVIEIGPGSQDAVKYKTLPLLRALKNNSLFSSYTAVDLTLSYAQDACIFIKNQFPFLNTHAIKADFLSPNSFKKIDSNQQKKETTLVVSFGQTFFANNNAREIDILLENVSLLLNEGDYLITGADTTQDKKILEKAYNTSLTRKLLLNVMHHLKTMLNLKDFNPEAFELVYELVEEASLAMVKLYLQPTLRQLLKINEQEFLLDPSQKFNILNSSRPSLKGIEKILRTRKIITEKIVICENDTHNKFLFLITRKDSSCNA